MEFDLGLLGGGQLARMSIQAAQKMGLLVASYDEAIDTPAGKLAPAIQGKLGDPEGLARFISRCRKVSFENEFVPANQLLQGIELAGREPDVVLPGVKTLAVIQDKLLQRQALMNRGVPCPYAMAIEGNGTMAAERIGFPMVLKVRFGGYDGKGTIIVHSQEEFLSHRHRWDAGGWLAEEFIPFRRELAVMVARNQTVEIQMETVETQQVNCVCDVTYPARLWSEATDVGAIPLEAVRAVDGFGLFGIELFELESGEILVNEMAPRPHNTGHYSLDWGDLSQFDLHVRLAMGLAIPHPSDGILKGAPVYMINLFGIEGANNVKKGIETALELEPSAHIHWYEKTESRLGRKMGHINLQARHNEPPHTILPRLHRIREAFYEGWRQSV